MGKHVFYDSKGNEIYSTQPEKSKFSEPSINIVLSPKRIEVEIKNYEKGIASIRNVIANHSISFKCENTWINIRKEEK